METATFIFIELGYKFSNHYHYFPLLKQYFLTLQIHYHWLSATCTIRTNFYNLVIIEKVLGPLSRLFKPTSYIRIGIGTHQLSIPSLFIYVCFNTHWQLLIYTSEIVSITQKIIFISDIKGEFYTSCIIRTLWWRKEQIWWIDDAKNSF